MQNPYFFYFLAVLILSCSAALLINRSILKSSLFLVLSMIGIGFLYMLMGAYFLSFVQIALYAGAVMVLFIMVLMAMGEKEDRSAQEASLVTFFKISIPGILVGLIGGALSLQTLPLRSAPQTFNLIKNVKEMSQKLFTDYVLVFELIGLLLFVMSVAIVAIAKWEED